MLKFLLYPFSRIYGFITWVRNQFYDRGVFSTFEPRILSICIGNLQVGGSGKTPMTAFLFNLLKDRYKIAILMRGYGRRTKGLIEAGPESKSGDIGDEALWYSR